MPEATASIKTREALNKIDRDGDESLGDSSKSGCSYTAYARMLEARNEEEKTSGVEL